MAEFFADYGLFLLKVATVVIAILIIIGALFAAGNLRGKGKTRGYVEVKYFNDQVSDYRSIMRETVLTEAAAKKLEKEDKKREKAHKKQRLNQLKKANSKAEDKRRKRIYVIDFYGDMQASAVEHMREEITSVLTLAEPEDEVLVRLESGGGLVHAYGLAASQLSRFRSRGIPLTISVDKVAASGGYMMACVANKLIAAPFAVLGSIGVVAQLPNFYRLLKKNNIDYELITAGEYKRTLTMLGENTDKGRKKFKQDIEETHVLFKNFVGEHRQQIDLDQVANGDIWFGKQAIDNGLIDEIKTSDEYLLDAVEEADIYEVQFVERKTLQERLGITVKHAVESAVNQCIERLQQVRTLV